jgi:hypothetical protein
MKKKVLIVISIAVGFGFIGLVIAAHVLARRIDPYVRQQAILYLQRRFESEVELASLRVSVPNTSALKLLLNRGRGTTVRVEGDGVLLRHKGRHDVPPMFVMKRFTCELDLATLFDTPKIVRSVSVSGMEINIPPTGERPDLRRYGDDSGINTEVIVQEADIATSVLSIYPRERNQPPLRFELQHIKLESVGKSVAMDYEAQLINAKPPGQILSKGKFGPWAAADPGNTPLAGQYEFNNADLGVFSGIAGILDSTGQFTGTLAAIEVLGQASVPDFRLKMSGNRVPLKTQFHVLVDGRNGNTILKPVHGTLGITNFSTSGGIIRHDAEGQLARRAGPCDERPTFYGGPDFSPDENRDPPANPEGSGKARTGRTIQYLRRQISSQQDSGSYRRIEPAGPRSAEKRRNRSSHIRHGRHLPPSK